MPEFLFAPEPRGGMIVRLGPDRSAKELPSRIPPTRGDIRIANAVAKHTSPRTERAAEWLTLGADEHVLLAIAAAWWLYCRGGRPQQRKNADHVLLTTLVVSAAPHLLKTIFDQRRPDRVTVLGHLHGVPFSGKPLDAFPSGHAMHVGALVSAATLLQPAKRNLVWAFGVGLALSRVVLLAHWASDVVAGLALGAATERLLRPFTKFGKERPPARRPEASSRGESHLKR